MKTAILLLASCVAAFASPATAAGAPVNATSAPISDAISEAPTPTKRNSSGMRPQDEYPYYYWYCQPPKNAVYGFYRLTKAQGPYDCTIPPLAREWNMLASYRDGGIQNVHWKYTDNVNDPECLENWTYHAADGRTVKTYVSGRTTTYGQNRRWCGLPVYNDGGVEGYQWAYCKCEWRF